MDNGLTYIKTGSSEKIYFTSIFQICWLRKVFPGCIGGFYNYICQTKTSNIS